MNATKSALKSQVSPVSPASRERLAARAKLITSRELQRYSDSTQGSQRANARARRVMPLGVPSSFQAYDPYPIVVRRAEGAYMEDVDGHRYVDFDMGDRKSTRLNSSH